MIRQLLFIGFFAGFLNAISAQTFAKVVDLSSRIEETSGLLYLNGRLLTHNDSGGSVKLYEIDTVSGEVINDVFLTGATLTDWEDICADETYIYVGDFGNNVGERVNLKIYRISIADYFDGDQIADAKVLDFKYADQTDFEPAQFQTNFDAETLISYGDSLLVFSKNWGNGSTRIYNVSKVLQPEQELSPLAELPVEGLITGGVYDSVAQRIILVGYENFMPFLIALEVDGTFNFSTFEWTKYELDTQGGSTQIEGVSLAENGAYFLSGERRALSEPTLYRFAFPITDTTTSSIFEGNTSTELEIYPNPAHDVINIQGRGFERGVLYNMKGERVLEASSRKLDVSLLPRGTYTLKTFTPGGKQQASIIVLE